MRASPAVIWSWVVALGFALAVVFLGIDRLNLYATPPELPETNNLVQNVLATIDYRQAIWPIYLLNNLFFAVGFAGVIGFAAVIWASGQGDTTGRATVFALLVTGSALGAASALLSLGAVEAAVWIQYCDCGFKEQEIVSQTWAVMVANDVGNWLLRGAGILLGGGLYAWVRTMGAAIPGGLRLLAQVTAVILVLAPVLGFINRFGDVPDLLTFLAALVLVPVWAVWTGRLLARSATSG